MEEDKREGEVKGEVKRRKRRAWRRIEVPDEVVFRYRNKLSLEDIKYLMKVGVIRGVWDEVELRVLDAFARVWMLDSFLKRLLVRRRYRDRVMIVETAGFGRLGSLIFSIVRREVWDKGKVNVDDVVREVCEKLNVDTEGFRRYVRELTKRIKKHVYFIISQSIKVHFQKKDKKKDKIPK